MSPIGCNSRDYDHLHRRRVAEHVKGAKPTVDRFELAIADGFTFRDKPDMMGVGMAIVLDAILAHGFGPDCFEQHSGYRLYRYKPL